ncbi:MAG: EAL domain-containing protein [Steroidobacteraceae bacterium]|nr:EAL domain-containing protein [Steroidobacteraceae bacterium]
MIGASLKSKYLAVAALCALISLATVAGMMVYQNWSAYSGISRLLDDTTNQRVGEELRLRSAAVADQLAAAVAVPTLMRDRAAIERIGNEFATEATIVSISIRDAAGEELFRFSRGDVPAEPLTRAALRSVRVMRPDTLGSGLQSVGEVEVKVRAAQPADAAARADVRLASLRRQQLIRGLIAAGVFGLTVLLAGLTLAWWAGRRLQLPLAQLLKGAERISQGDYSRPLDVGRRDEIGDLQSALERMRHKLRQNTVSKNYITHVLSSMTDAVFVTSPDGVIRMANHAACKLMSYGEEELVGRTISSILTEEQRAGFDLLQAAHETRETVVNTRQGQSIPVLLSGSVISSDDPQYQGTIFVARNITDRKRAERRIRYLARYDALTKVPNRMQFQHLLQQAIARALRSKQALALLYIDMDHFKEINDTFGHAAGDRALEILAERLGQTVPKDTVVGRLAGDEFALFIEGLPADEDNRGTIAQFSRKLLEDISRAFQVANQEVYLTGSVGIAMCPRDATNVIDIIRNADAAMYHAKQNGGNSFSFYSPEMNAAAVERLMLKSKLRRALERDEFLVRYQPKVDLRDGRIVGAEALLRWRLPGHGDIPPGQFIPLAEETNLILEVGEWVLNRVCMDYRELQVAVENPGRISLNLSLKQLRQASFILRFRSVFRKHGVAPSCFELEITETTLMADAKRTVRLLDELYAMGLHLSIDDFGTGYSSLSALQQFPIGTLKVDQSFVRDIGEDESDATIVRTVIEMGRSLGMEVVAEGVESAVHMAFLRAHHCPFGQGRLFGEPLTLEDLRLLLERQRVNGPAFGHLIRESALQVDASQHAS